MKDDTAEILDKPMWYRTILNGSGRGLMIRYQALSERNAEVAIARSSQKTIWICSWRDAQMHK